MLIHTKISPRSEANSGWQSLQTLQADYGLHTYGTDPVKLIPAKWGEEVMVSPNTGPSAGTKLTTPGGTPASVITLKIVQLESNAVSDGFHNTAQPYA